MKLLAQSDRLSKNVEKKSPDEVKSQVKEWEKPTYSSNRATFINIDFNLFLKSNEIIIGKIYPPV